MGKKHIKSKDGVPLGTRYEKVYSNLVTVKMNIIL